MCCMYVAHNIHMLLSSWSLLLVARTFSMFVLAALGLLQELISLGSLDTTHCTMYVHTASLSLACWCVYCYGGLSGVYWYCPSVVSVPLLACLLCGHANCAWPAIPVCTPHQTRSHPALTWTWLPGSATCTHTHTHTLHVIISNYLRVGRFLIMNIYLAQSPVNNIKASMTCLALPVAHTHTCFNTASSWLAPNHLHI